MYSSDRDFNNTTFLVGRLVNKVDGCSKDKVLPYLTSGPLAVVPNCPVGYTNCLAIGSRASDFQNSINLSAGHFYSAAI